MLLKYRSLICAVLFLFLGCNKASVIETNKLPVEKSEGKVVINAVIDLKDNSRIIGTIASYSILLQTDFGKIEIPIEQISNIAFRKDNKTVNIELNNNDKLSGILALKTLKIEAIFGKISINVESINKIILSNKKRPKVDGLIAYYPFNNNAKDESGNKNDGVAYGAMLTTDRFGKGNSAYSFDGDSYIDVGNNKEFNFGGGKDNFTIGAWIYRISSSASGASGGIISKAREKPYSGWAFAVYSDGRLSFSGVGIWEVVSQTKIPLNQWVYVAVTRNAKIYTLYINGITVATKHRSGKLETYSDGILTIGATYLKWKHSRFFTGDIDKVFILNRALSKSEILEEYNLID